MRVLAVSNLYAPRVLGGYERSAREICDALRERGHDVLVLTSPSERPTDVDGVDRSLSMLAYLDPQPTDPAIKLLVDHRCMASQRDNTLVLLDRIRSFRPDVVLFFNLIGIGGLALVDLVRECGIPWVWNLGDRVPAAMLEGSIDDVRAIYGGVERLFQGGRVTVVSNVLRSDIEAAGVPLPDDTVVIPRGFRAATGTPRKGRAGRKGRVGRKIRFLSAGTLSEEKGTGLLLDAAAILAEEVGTRFELRIAGPGDLDAYRRRVVQRGLERVVRIEGELDRDALAEQYAWSDVFLFPGRDREPFGRVPFEAVAHGSVPVLAVGTAAAEWFLDGVDSVKTSRDPRAFATVMARALRGEYELPRMAEAGGRLLAGAVAFDRTIDAHERVLREAARDYTPAPDAVGARALERDREALLAIHRAAGGLAQPSDEVSEGAGHSGTVILDR